MSNILFGLNDQQKEAVITTEGYVRVIAGAGAGKTRTLTTRYAYLVDELDVSPNRILSVTFTNKAANEMKERITKMIGDVGAPYIMTFHGFCNRFLHSEIEVLDISSNFKIMDTDDQLDILKVVYNELGITNKDFPYKRALTEIIGAGCKNGQRTYLSNYEELIEKYSSFELNQLMQISPSRELKIIYGYLREQKRDACLDYEDLLNFALYILKTRKEVRDVWEGVFDYIQVDEFQDVSLREVELVSILSTKCGNLFVVGDDSQCLVEGTKIRTPDGFKKIEEIKQGDFVLSAVGNGKVEPYKVENMIFKPLNDMIYTVKTKGGKIIKATGEHVGFANNGISIEHSDNDLTYTLFNKDTKHTLHRKMGDKVIVFEDVKSEKLYHKLEAILKECDNNNIELSVKRCARFTNNTYEFTSFSDLKVGMHIPVYDNGIIIDDTIESIDASVYYGRVFDLNIPNARNFIADDIVVHNCIYGWRGSDVSCLVKFKEIMDKVQGRDNEVKTVMLTTNYRSTPQILDASNGLIKHNQIRVDKDLVPVKLDGKRVLHYHARNIYSEADWVAKRILSLRRPFSDIAVLYRSNTSSRAIEEKLIENAIPYEVLSGISFYSRKEVKDVLAMLSIVAFGDNLSFMRMVKTLSLGIGPKKIDKLRELSEGKASLYQTLRVNAESKLFKSTKAKWLVDLVEGLKAYSETDTIAVLMGRVYTALNLEEMYKESEIERWENLQELKRSAQHYEHAQREKVDLGEYLSMLSLYTSSDGEESANKVKLMTIHASKGLEYPVVFVIGMNEGLMPSSRTCSAYMMEEERRIAYVAMTRAKELLFLTDAEGENFDNSYRLPSRFLFNIPRDTFDTEGKLDNVLIRQVEAKVAEDKIKFGESQSSLLDNIEDRFTIAKGSRVRHSKFGEGTVMQLQEGIIVVLFDEFGIKGIRSDTTKLEII